ncbi:Putative CENP-V/GFA domain, Mss4-like superfamily protein [Septoria linicola]|uniref:CENP-V/GFA domain, Mss4-like superfamily protein n=1 Tax=Septoria linicola TaxID=215465 RepID=A0A9Q9EQ73_9PEZI|nr:Putative CENP-V/GFA domain, Mss4-like superfamily protein [Septoria linicola]
MSGSDTTPKDDSFFDQVKMSPIVTVPVPKTLTCLCKAISIEVTGQDQGTVLCHCNNCKQAAGSAFMDNHRFVESSLRIIRGGDHLREARNSGCPAQVSPTSQD